MSKGGDLYGSSRGPTEHLLGYNSTSPHAAFDEYPAQERTAGLSSTADSGSRRATTKAGRLWAMTSYYMRNSGGKSRMLLLIAVISVVFLLHDQAGRLPGPRTWADVHPHAFERPSSTKTAHLPVPTPDVEPEDDSDEKLAVLEDPDAVPTEPPPTTHVLRPGSKSSNSHSSIPLADEAEFIQPRRRIRPARPDPWADLPKSWIGHKLLSPARFGSGSELGSKGLSDPPQRDAPPARYLSKAFDFSAALARHVTAQLKTYKSINARVPPTFDSQTGRPVAVPHKDVFITQSGWKPPAGIKVSDLKGRKKMPRVQSEKIVDEGLGKGNMRESERQEEEKHRREWVKRAYLHAWEGYKKHAWGHDELMPVSNLFSDNYNGWGASIVDNLDTLLLMDLSHEYNLARQHVSDLDFTFLVPSGARTFSTALPDLSKLEPPAVEALQREDGMRYPKQRLKDSDQHSPTTIPHFETAIRYLGGLLSAYELSGDPLMLERATELGDWLLPSLGTKHGLAINRYVLGSNPDGLPIGRVTLAEVGSLTLEFTKLSMLTGNEIYYQAVQRSMDTLDMGFKRADPPPVPGQERFRGRLGSLLPANLDPAYPDNLGGEYTFGGLADSYYEYLIKQAQLVSDAIPQYSRMYAEAIDSAYDHLVQRVEVVPGRDDLTIIGSVKWGTFLPVLEHLTCFAGGMLSLGSKLLKRDFDLQTGINVTEACAWAYESTETGLGPESLMFYRADESTRYMSVTLEKVRRPRGNPVIGVRNANQQYIGRPETIESVFYQWRITGDRKWQDRGWQMFTSWMEHSITESGFASISAVTSAAYRQRDSMESFVLAESLKYYYLLFSPRDFISLDDWVFNTEAHPLHIPKTASTPKPQSLWKGPDASTPMQSFVSTVGEGTWVQKWARVQQAAALMNPGTPATRPDADGAGKLADVAVRPPIRPPELDIVVAEGGAKGEHFAKAPERPPRVPAGGGGRGMGGGFGLGRPA